MLYDNSIHKYTRLFKQRKLTLSILIIICKIFNTNYLFLSKNIIKGFPLPKKY